MTTFAQQMLEAKRYDTEQRLRRFRAAWDAYYGRHPKPLRVKPGQPDDNIIVNFAALIVDKSVEFLFGKPVKFGTDHAEGAESREETWLTGCWKANRHATTLLKLATNGGVTGHAFLKVAKPGAGETMPRLIVLDPAIVEAEWSPDDVDRVERYTIEYPAIEPGTGKPMVYRQRIERDGVAWHITDERARPDSATWERVGEERWPYRWAPIHECQNLPAPNVHWGIADLEADVIGLNQALNFALTNLNRILRFHAHPKTVGKGFSADQMKVAPDGTIVLPNPQADLKNLEMLSDLSSSIEFYKRLKEALHEVAQLPEVATGRTENIGALSGLALKVLYGPLLALTEKKRLTYGELLGDLNRHLLEMGGFGDVEVTNEWPYALPADPKEEAEIALLDQQLGASQETLLTRRGYDAQRERERREVESAGLGEQLLRAFDAGKGQA